MNLGEYLSDRAVEIAHQTMGEIEAGNLKNRQQVREFIDHQLGQTSSDLLALASGASSPLIASLTASMQPMIEQVLSDYTPTFAAVSGGMLAFAVLLGIWVSKKTFERAW